MTEIDIPKKIWNKTDPGYDPRRGIYRYIQNRMNYSDNAVHKYNKVIKRYARQILLIDTKGKHLIELSNMIQKDFDAFAKWFKENY